MQIHSTFLGFSYTQYRYVYIANLGDVGFSERNQKNLNRSQTIRLAKGPSLVNIEEKQRQIVEEFQSMNNWEERYKKIIARGRSMSPLNPKDKTDSNIVKGCQSKVWMIARMDGPNMIIEAESDASIVQGLISLLVEVYSNQSPSEILQHPPKFIEEIGLGANLSQTRANGLASMVKQIKFYAIAFQSQL